MVSLKLCSGFPQCPLLWPITPLVKVQVPYVQASLGKSGQREGKCLESKVWLRKLGTRPSSVTPLWRVPRPVTPLSLPYNPSFSPHQNHWAVRGSLQYCSLQASFFSPCVLETLCSSLFSSAHCIFPLHISFFKIILDGGIPQRTSGQDSVLWVTKILQVEWQRQEKKYFIKEKDITWWDRFGLGVWGNVRMQMVGVMLATSASGLMKGGCVAYYVSLMSAGPRILWWQ